MKTSSKKKKYGLIPALRKHFAQEKANLKQMTFKEKLDHIWSYYKEYMFIALVLIIIIVVIISAAMNAGTVYYTCGVMSNVELSIEGHTYLTDTFFEDVLGDPDGRIFLTPSELPVQEVSVGDTTDRYNAYMGVTSQIEGKDLDYMLMDEFSFSFYTDDRVYLDLSTLLSPEDLQWLYDQNMIVQTRSDVQTQGTPHGIDISKLPFGQDCLLTEGPCYLVFIRNSDQKANCLKLWEHIKNWESVK